ncbi:MAG: hypothetical protein ABI747_00360 [Candidatus Moraniibacteriota bacterium]
MKSLIDQRADLTDLLQGLKKRSETAWSVLRAIWKTGIPERFWLFFFVSGIVLGFGMKSLAQNTITVGHDDYQLRQADSLYDLNRTEDEALAEGANLTAPEEKKIYPSCSLDQ